MYVLWVPRNGAREKHVERVAGLVHDPRASHFWDEHGALVEPYAEMLSLTGPCAGIFMLFEPGVRWEGASPPPPDYYEDAHAVEFDREGPQFDADRFARIAEGMLAG